MEENNIAQTENLSKKKQLEFVKRSSKITEKGLVAAQYAAWLLGIISLIIIIIMAIFPDSIAKWLFSEQVIEQFGCGFFNHVTPLITFLLVIIALLFYGFSHLLKNILRCRLTINQLYKQQDEQTTAE